MGALVVVTTIVGGAILLLAGWLGVRRVRRFYQSRDVLREQLLSDTQVTHSPGAVVWEGGLVRYEPQT